MNEDLEIKEIERLNVLEITINSLKQNVTYEPNAYKRVELNARLKTLEGEYRCLIARRYDRYNHSDEIEREIMQW